MRTLCLFLIFAIPQVDPKPAIITHFEAILAVARKDRTTRDKDTFDAIAEASESGEVEINHADRVPNNWKNLRVSLHQYAIKIQKLSGQLKDKTSAAKIATEAKAVEAATKAQ